MIFNAFYFFTDMNEISLRSSLDTSTRMHTKAGKSSRSHRKEAT